MGGCYDIIENEWYC